MATPLKLYFSKLQEFYNAVYFANAIGDAQPGTYDITLQAVHNRSSVPNAITKDPRQYDLNSNNKLDANELQAVISELTDTTANEFLFGSHITTLGEIFSGPQFAAEAFGFAPSIRHDLTINFEFEDTRINFSFSGGRFVIIENNRNINGKDFYDNSSTESGGG